jgi:hypothetical protein
MGLGALIWKEWREHGGIVLVLALFSIVVLVAAALWAQPGNPFASVTDLVRYLGIGRLAAVMLTATAGMVCGSALFAAERENNTFTFLETLPLSRRSLWFAKLIAGATLTLLLWGIICITSAILHILPSWSSVAALGIYAAITYAWGMLGSTWARSTLGAVGLAVVAAILSAILLLLPVVMWWPSPGQLWLRPRILYLFALSMILLPVSLSLLWFTAPDRRRTAEDGAASCRPRGGLLPLAEPLLACLWLTARQLHRPMLVLLLLALGSGLLLLVPPVVPWLWWPPLALLLGVLTAALLWSDEQVHQVYRYWSEQRLPVVLLGTAKLLVAAGMILVLLGVMALPLVVGRQVGLSMHLARNYTLPAALLRTPLLDELGRYAWWYLLAPAIYGLAAGWWCSLLIRKRVPATGAALLVGGWGMLLWEPSLLAGGLRTWQLWAPPFLCLLGGWALLGAWTRERLWQGRGLAGMGITLALVTITMGAGLAWRVWELPNSPDSEQDVAYIATLPPFDENLAGRDMHAAAEACARQAATLREQFDRPEPRRVDGVGQSLKLEDRLEAILRRGWPEPGQDPALEQWLDALFTPPLPDTASDNPPWFNLAYQAAFEPRGIYEYPQLFSSTKQWTTYDHARRLATFVLVRGLQQQQRGQPDYFLRALHVALGLVCHLRQAAPLQGFYTAVEIERLSLMALERWLEAPHSPLLLHLAIQRLERHDRHVAPEHTIDSTPHFLAERFLLREMFDSPSQWLPLYLGLPQQAADDAPAEVEAILLAWNVPWERERNRRLLGLGLERGLPDDPSCLHGRPGLGLILGRMRSIPETLEHERHIRTWRRVALIRLALLYYHSQFRCYPPDLDTLVHHGLLQQLPADPYTPEPHPLRYRLIRPEITNNEGRQGELLRFPTLTPQERRLVLQLPSNISWDVFVPAGEAVLWSVGSDQIDQGGRNTPVGYAYNIGRPPDLVFLVTPQPRP